MGSTQAVESPSSQVSQGPTVYEVSGCYPEERLDGLYSVCGRFNGHDYFVNLVDREHGSAIFFDETWKLGSDLENWSFCSNSKESAPPISNWRCRHDGSLTCAVSTCREAVGNTIGAGGAALAARTVGGASSRSSRTRGGAHAEWSEFETSYDALGGKLMRKQRSSFDVYAVKRAQDQLSGRDFAKLHGYVILWLATPDQTDNIYVRIDWTDGGFETEENTDDNAFKSYMMSHPEEAAESLQDVDNWTAAVSALPIGATIGAIAATGPAATVLAASAYVVGVGSLFGQIFVTECADEAKQREQFVLVNKNGKTDGALQHLLVMLEQHQVECRQYDLATWNCNHVANSIFERLLMAGDVA